MTKTIYHHQGNIKMGNFRCERTLLNMPWTIQLVTTKQIMQINKIKKTEKLGTHCFRFSENKYEYTSIDRDMLLLFRVSSFLWFCKMTLNCQTMRMHFIVRLKNIYWHYYERRIKMQTMGKLPPVSAHSNPFVFLSSNSS